MTNVSANSKGTRRWSLYGIDAIDISEIDRRWVLAGLVNNAINKLVGPHKDCPEASSFFEPEQAGACLNRVLKQGYGAVRRIFAPELYFHGGLFLGVVFTNDDILVASEYNRHYDNSAPFVIRKLRNKDFSFMSRPLPPILST
jgi:hypothetical protein